MNRQATHALEPKFLVFFMNHRAVEGDPPSGTNYVAQFSLFFMFQWCDDAWIEILWYVNNWNDELLVIIV